MIRSKVVAPGVLVVVLASASQAVLAQQAAVSAPTEWSGRQREYLSRATEWGFSGAVMVEYRGQALIAEGFGWSDSLRDMRNTPATLFDLGSVSKQFTATAAIVLVEAGQLNLSAPMSKYFNNLPPDKAAITLHQLLTHTSGLPREVAPDFVDLTREEFETRVFAAPLIAVPGARFSYSNAGYRLVADLVERVSGLPFRDFLRERLFIPADLSATGFYGETGRGTAQGNVAVAMGSAVDGQSPSQWTASWGNAGSGGVVSSVADLLRWERAIRSGQILSRRGWQLLFTSNSDGVGYGWMIRQLAAGHRMIRHDGAWYAFGSDFDGFPTIR